MKKLLWLIVIGIIAGVSCSQRHKSQEDTDYEKYNTIQIGDCLEDVSTLLGRGRRIDIADVPTRQSRAQNNKSTLEPVVSGDTIYIWDRKTHIIYIGVDKNKFIESKFFLDQNSL